MSFYKYRHCFMDAILLGMKLAGLKSGVTGEIWAFLIVYPFSFLMNIESVIEKFSNGSKRKLNVYALPWVMKTSIHLFSWMNLQYLNMFALVVHIYSHLWFIYICNMIYPMQILFICLCCLKNSP